jgi:hypothetical protein
MSKILLFALTLIVAGVFTHDAFAQGRRNTAPNSGTCADGKKVRDLATCNTASTAKPKKKKTQ